jgi:hypothetical protein
MKERNVEPNCIRLEEDLKEKVKAEEEDVRGMEHGA